MMTHTTLLAKIAEQTKDSNEELREQLKNQILEDTSKSSKSLLQDFSERYQADFKALTEQNQAFKAEVQTTNELLSEQIETLGINLKKELNQELSTNNVNIVAQICSEYDKKISELELKLNEKLDSEIVKMIKLSKNMSDGISNIQKDTAVIMETLQLVLTNLLLNDVSDKHLKG